MKLRSAARTDVGRTRDHNEDSFGTGEAQAVGDLGELLVVCDGMGGHAAGEVASRLAVDTIIEAYYADAAAELPEALERAFVAANALVYRQGNGSMGTTAVAAVLHHDALHVANVGDSRAYLVRDGTIRQITRDHSFVGDQVAAGLLTPAQARVSAHRNIITRAIGHQAQVTVDVFRWPLQIGDLVLLCSDGLYGLVDDDELLEYTLNTAFDDLPGSLVDLANARGGTDNITALVVEVTALDWDAQPVGDDTEPASAATPEITARLVPPPAAALPLVSPVPMHERRLSLIGGLLSALLLATLLFAILFVYINPAPDAALPVPTAATPATAVGSPLPAALATPAATPASATKAP